MLVLDGSAVGNSVPGATTDGVGKTVGASVSRFSSPVGAGPTNGPGVSIPKGSIPVGVAVGVSLSDEGTYWVGTPVGNAVAEASSAPPAPSPLPASVGWALLGKSYGVVSSVGDAVNAPPPPRLPVDGALDGAPVGTPPVGDNVLDSSTGGNERGVAVEEVDPNADGVRVLPDDGMNVDTVGEGVTVAGDVVKTSAAPPSRFWIVGAPEGVAVDL